MRGETWQRIARSRQSISSSCPAPLLRDNQRPSCPSWVPKLSLNTRQITDAEQSDLQHLDPIDPHVQYPVKESLRPANEILIANCTAWRLRGETCRKKHIAFLCSGHCLASTHRYNQSDIITTHRIVGWVVISIRDSERFDGGDKACKVSIGIAGHPGRLAWPMKSVSRTDLTSRWRGSKHNGRELLGG